MTMGVALCVFASPAVVTGAVIVIGTVVAAVAIKEALDAYELSASHESVRRNAQTRHSSAQDPVSNNAPTSRDLGRDWLPPESSDPSERPECKPFPGPPRGGNEPHNECANKVPGNNFPGQNVFVNGKHFDALTLATRTLWEVKTDNFDKHEPRSQEFFIRVKLPELRREKRLAEACGYNFAIGVRSKAHLFALRSADPSLTVVLMDWC